jgi:serpin B
MMLFALLAGCVPAEDDHQKVSPGSDPDPAPRCEPAEVEVTDAARSVADSNNAFAVDMYATIAETAPVEQNLFFSPFSISSALGMTLAGAEDETAAQMRDVFHIGDDAAAHHAGYSDLRTAVFTKGVNCDATLNMANRLFGQVGYSWFEGFLDVTADDYGAPLEELDFEADPDDARVYINDWVADQTEDRILDLLPVGSIDASTRLVLANAIYFKGDWEHAFKVSNTRDVNFRRPDGSTVQAPIMFETIEARSAIVDGFLAVELDYQGGNQSMVLMMPESSESDASAFEAELVQSVEDSLADLGEVWVGLPRFSFEQETGLSDVLKNMGMVDAFEASVADLDGMVGQQDSGLYIGGAYHKAFVAVDEVGTEAAAATAVVVSDESATMTFDFVADRTFEFYIRDNHTGAILFMGRVSDPTAE